MKLKVISIEGKGDLGKEVVWLDVLEDCDLQDYMVSDTTYTGDDTISNELRHMFWFPKRLVKKGDYVALLTREGANGTSTNSRKTTSHQFYWKLGRTVWNKDGDCAVLFQLSTWKPTKA